MAGPNQRSIRKTIIPLGEAQTLYSPDNLARRVQNLKVTAEKTLRAVQGPAILEPDREQAYPLGGVPHAIYQGSLRGHDDTLLVRVNSRIYRQAGWNRDFQELEGGLTNESEPRFPDQFVRFGDRVIWCNGIDRPRVVKHDGRVTALGFDKIPGTLLAQGPDNPPLASAATEYPNSRGYSWPGRIGTPGDSLNGQAGSVLAGQWMFYEMWQDADGNLSAPSPPSNPVSIHTIQADPYDASSSSYAEHGYDIDDLLKQFRVISSGDAPDDHCVARFLFRTPDMRNAGNEPQLVGRFAGRRALDYSCSMSDAELGFPMPPTIPVPTFKLACVHHGRLIVANTVGDPSIVRRSEPGFPGTFLRDEFVFPDNSGGEVTGITSFGGRLIVFTEDAIYDCTDFARPVAISHGIGCVAPSSIRAHSAGLLIWLGRDGFYGMEVSGGPEPLSGPIQDTIEHRLNHGRLRLAAASINPESGAYVCAVPLAGYAINNLLLEFSESGWRRYDLGVHIAGLVGTKDERRYLLGIGQNISDSQTHVFVFDRETEAFTAPKQQVRFESSLLMNDELGMHPAEVHKLYIGFRDRWDGEMTLLAYRNGETVASVSRTFRMLGTDEHDDQAGNNPSTQFRDVLDKATVGTSSVHEPRMYWRRVDINMKTVFNWRFELYASYPTDCEIVAFAFDVSRASSGDPLARISRGDDA